jgi:hypothetical protein
MPSPSVLALNYKTVFHNVGRRFVNLDSLPCCSLALRWSSAARITYVLRV